jgi:hypothetical protein
MYQKKRERDRDRDRGRDRLTLSFVSLMQSLVQQALVAFLGPPLLHSKNVVFLF